MSEDRRWTVSDEVGADQSSSREVAFARDALLQTVANSEVGLMDGAVQSVVEQHDDHCHHDHHHHDHHHHDHH